MSEDLKPAYNHPAFAQPNRSITKSKENNMSNLITQTLKFELNELEDANKLLSLSVKEDERVVNIRSVTFLIAEKGSVEPPMEVTPDLSSQADVHVDERIGDLASDKVKSTYLIKFTYSIHKTGEIKVGLWGANDTDLIKSTITAKVTAEVEQVTDKDDYERPDIRAHAVKESPATATMTGREIRTIYHMGQDTTLFVVGLDEDLTDQDVELSEVWEKDNLKDLTKDEIELLRGDDTAKISLSRAEKSQDALEKIYRSIYGIPTAVAVVNGKTYYLPIIEHDGNAPVASLISSLNFEYWHDIRQMLPHELQKIDTGLDPQHIIVTIHTALNRQMDWAYANTH